MSNCDDKQTQCSIIWTSILITIILCILIATLIIFLIWLYFERRYMKQCMLISSNEYNTLTDEEYYDSDLDEDDIDNDINPMYGGDITNEQRKEYKKSMSQIFYLFAGMEFYSMKNKSKKQLWMSKNDLETFINIVNIIKPNINYIFSQMDIENDNRIDHNEFVNYFCDINTNPYCFKIQRQIENEYNWKLLKKALKIFELFDKNHDGRLTYDEFLLFTSSIGLDNNVNDIKLKVESDKLWKDLDTDNSNDITIKELFEWFRFRFLMNLVEDKKNVKVGRINKPQLPFYDDNEPLPYLPQTQNSNNNDNISQSNVQSVSSLLN